MDIRQMVPDPGTGDAAARDFGTSSFASKVFSLLEKVEYRRCDKGEDLEDIYRLRYKAYRSNDMVPDDERHSISDELDETANVHRFGIYIDQRLLSTMRIHHVTKIEPASPSTKAFGDIVLPMLDAGDTFVCMSRFASDPEWTRVYPQLAYVTLRLAGMACFYFEASYGLSTVRDDHAGFYRRIYYSEQISEARSYPGVFNKVVLFRTNPYANKERYYARFPFFRSTPMERRMLFETPGRGELAPLTILPTAKYFREAA
ncbi:N-acyl amino acid synthase FeeM domain-containing protein [Mesorhizobium sp. A623]